MPFFFSPWDQGSTDPNGKQLDVSGKNPVKDLQVRVKGWCEKNEETEKQVHENSFLWSSQILWKYLVFGDLRFGSP